MIKGKKPRFGVFRKRYLICYGRSKEKDDKDWTTNTLKLECGACGEVAALRYSYGNVFVFFWKRKAR